MLDQLKIGEKSSFDDFNASVAMREIEAPTKKVIKETVPFSNLTYDFSAINGELYWEERVLKYVFEIIAESPADLEHKKAVFANWVMNVMNENLYDPHDPKYHYRGTFDSLEWEDDEGMEKTTATVTFAAYPYRIANEPTIYAFTVPAATEDTFVIENKSGHRITPTVTADKPMTVSMNGVTYIFEAGMSKDDVFTLAIGDNSLLVNNAEADECTVEITFVEEVF